MNTTPSIALLVCHFGTFPWYLQYFIQSCKYNPTVDFFIITDNLETIPNLSNNVKIVHQTLDVFRNHASKTLDLKISNYVNNNKLSDFKPAYGLLFSEILSGYDFWGYTDLDIIFGNIRGFMTDDILKNHAIVSGRHDCIYNKFCLFKNNEDMQTLFKQSRDYQNIFSRPQRFYFDGCNVHLDQQMQMSILDFSNCLQSMSFVVKKAELENQLNVFYDFLGLAGLAVLKDGVYWNKGALYYKNKFECMYYDLTQYYIVCQHKKVPERLPDVFGFAMTLPNSFLL
ncbi:MAG TPA: hypothetical protein DDZ41_01610 [Flavobacterium sp.]|nr:hypothetical protein [Flavobacterium sp.]